MKGKFYFDISPNCASVRVFAFLIKPYHTVEFLVVILMSCNFNSKYVILLGLSTPQPTGEDGSTSVSENLTLILVALAAAVVLLIVVIVTVVTFLACRRQPTTTVVMRQRRSSKPPDEFELSEGGFGEGFHRRSAQYAASLYVPEIDEIHRRFSGL